MGMSLSALSELGRCAGLLGTNGTPLAATVSVNAWSSVIFFSSGLPAGNGVATLYNAMLSTATKPGFAAALLSVGRPHTYVHTAFCKATTTRTCFSFAGAMAGLPTTGVQPGGISASDAPASSGMRCSHLCAHGRGLPLASRNSMRTGFVSTEPLRLPTKRTDRVWYIAPGVAGAGSLTQRAYTSSRPIR